MFSFLIVFCRGHKVFVQDADQPTAQRPQDMMPYIAGSYGVAVGADPGNAFIEATA